MIFEPLKIPGAFRITLTPHLDRRGLFARRFCAEEFQDQNLETHFIQRSISVNTRRGTLRGLHFQAEPYAETKLVRCVRGAMFDVLADVRENSPTRGQWHGEALTADNRTILYIPAGVAHGFQTLVDDTEVDYEITPAYRFEAARGLRPDDPTLAIDWPIADRIVSDADMALPSFFAL